MSNTHSGGEVSTVNVLITSTQILAEDMSRNYATITNTSTTVTIWCAINKPAEVGKGFPLYPGMIYEINQTNLTRSPIYGISTSGTVAVAVAVGR